MPKQRCPHWRRCRWFRARKWVRERVRRRIRESVRTSTDLSHDLSLQADSHRGELFREVNWYLSWFFTVTILSAFIVRQGNPKNSTFLRVLLSLRSVGPRGPLSITLFHLFWKRFSLKNIFLKKEVPKKNVTGARDSIVRTSLFETFLMMCHSTSELSLWVWMQFYQEPRITLTWHLATTSLEARYLYECRFDWLSLTVTGEGSNGPGDYRRQLPAPETRGQFLGPVLWQEHIRQAIHDPVNGKKDERLLMYVNHIGILQVGGAHTNHTGY